MMTCEHTHTANAIGEREIKTQDGAKTYRGRTRMVFFEKPDYDTNKIQRPLNPAISERTPTKKNKHFLVSSLSQLSIHTSIRIRKTNKEKKRNEIIINKCVCVCVQRYRMMRLELKSDSYDGRTQEDSRTRARGKRKKRIIIQRIRAAAGLVGVFKNNTKKKY